MSLKPKYPGLCPLKGRDAAAAGLAGRYHTGLDETADTGQHKGQTRSAEW